MWLKMDNFFTLPFITGVACHHLRSAPLIHSLHPHKLCNKKEQRCSTNFLSGFLFLLAATQKANRYCYYVDKARILCLDS